MNHQKAQENQWSEQLSLLFSSCCFSLARLKQRGCQYLEMKHTKESINTPSYNCSQLVSERLQNVMRIVLYRIKVSDRRTWRRRIKVCSKAVTDAIESTNKKNHTLTDHIVSLRQHKGKTGQSGIELLLFIDERQIPENTPTKFRSQSSLCWIYKPWNWLCGCSKWEWRGCNSLSTHSSLNFLNFFLTMPKYTLFFYIKSFKFRNIFVTFFPSASFIWTI